MTTAVLSCSKFKAFRVDSVRKITHDTVILRIDLGGKHCRTGMGVSSCLTVQPTKEYIDDVYIPKMKGTKTLQKLQAKNKLYKAKPFTPITLDDTGFMELLVKVYSEGRVSAYLGSIVPGDNILIKGREKLKWDYQKHMKNRNDKLDTLVMLCGGTGITPFFQILKKYHKELTQDKLPLEKFAIQKVFLIFANRTEEDILLRQELEEMAKLPQIEVTHILSQEPTDSKWTGARGHISADLLKSVLPDSTERKYALVCGCKGFYETVSGPRRSTDTVTGVLAELNFEPQQVTRV